MLILTRRIGESIIAGDDIVVTVLGSRGGQVRLGIDAPKKIRVDRSEVRAKINSGGYTPTYNSIDEKNIQEVIYG
jgi:carbon storage regulator